MFSNSTKYALKAVLYLAANSNEGQKIMAKDLAKPINVPKAYIAKLLQQLARNGMVSSTKGPKGGFYLSEENKERPLIEIIYMIEPGNKITSCVLSLELCNEQKPCPLHRLIAESKSSIIKNLEERTVNDILSDIEQGNSFLPL